MFHTPLNASTHHCGRGECMRHNCCANERLERPAPPQHSQDTHHGGDHSQKGGEHMRGQRHLALCCYVAVLLLSFEGGELCGCGCLSGMGVGLARRARVGGRVCAELAEGGRAWAG